MPTAGLDVARASRRAVSGFRARHLLLLLSRLIPLNRRLRLLARLLLIHLDDANLHAVHGGFDNRNTDAVTGLESRLNNDAVSVGSQDFDFTEAQPIVLIDNENLVGPTHRHARQHHDVAGGLTFDLGFNEHADRQRRTTGLPASFHSVMPPYWMPAWPASASILAAREARPPRMQ